MANEERKFDVSDLNEFTKVNEEEEVLDSDVQNDISFDDTKVFEWDAYEFEYHQKSNSWVFGLIAVVLVVVTIFVLMSNWMGVVMVLLGAVLIYQYAFKKPRKLHYILTKDGLLIDDKPYMFEKMVSYWISDSGVLYINAKWWPPRLSVQLDSVEVSDFDRFMKNFVNKEKRDENDTGDNLSKWLKF